MDKIQDFAIFASFIGLWVTSSLPVSFEIFLGYLLILSFGILHGSNDLLILNKILEKRIDFSLFRVLLVYILTIALAVITFYFLPVFALIIFIISSAYHFGQQHWEHRNLAIPDFLNIANYIIYGLVILQIIFFFNGNEVIEIVEQITSYTLTVNFIEVLTIVLCSLYIVLWLYLLVQHKLFQPFLWRELMYLLVFVVLFKVSTLIWSFALYFILWHSIPSLFEQVSFIYGRFNRINLIAYCKAAFPYWLASMIGITMVYLFFKDEKIFIALLFSFIAAVTFPHAIVINRLFANKKA